MQGYIKLHRQLQDWEWWEDHPTLILFITILFEANIERKKWQGQWIERGQLATSYRSLSAKSGLTVKQVRTALDKMIRSGTIRHKGQTKYSIITITKYDDFQGEGKQRANKGQTKGKQRATTKEWKNGRMEEIEVTKVTSKKPIAKKPDDVSQELWSEFLDYRRGMKARLTPTALKGFVREASNANISLSQAIEHTMLMGWRGFKAEWYNNQTKTKQNEDEPKW